jgi:hypothetical protein
MAYDIIEDAKLIDGLSTSVCHLAKRLGRRALVDSYTQGAGDHGLAVQLLINSYVEEKRRLTLNLLKWPHEAATLTTKDPTAIRVLNRIGRRQPLAADEIVQPLVASDEKRFEQFGLLWSYIPDTEASDISWDSFHGWHGTDDYLKGIIVARPLLATVSTRLALSRIIQEIRMCYAFGQFIAVYGLCRTLFETAVTDVCVRVGVLTKEDADSDYFSRRLRLKGRIDRTLEGSARREASLLYCELSRIVHGSAEPNDVDSVIRQTINLTERLHAQNASKISARTNEDQK